MNSALKMRVRFDYIGRPKASKLFGGGKNTEQQAEQIRQHKVSLIRNVPIQGIHIEDIDMSLEVYSIIDDISGKPVSYAPVVVTFYADTIEDAIKFVITEEFRTVEVVQPEELTLTRFEIERLFYQVGREFGDFKDNLERRINNWK
ncbi:MAG TPA: hypothetical protein VHQ70_01875 [Syntrophomonadaceae bacterium]|nr:hypothetical protein [Syntrophomonadaceae bacterium]